MSDIGGAGALNPPVTFGLLERALGGCASFQSVADYLIKRSKGPRPLFVRTRYGHYRLLRLNEP